MTKFIMRLDDACEKMDIIKWNRMEVLLDKYHIKPLVGVIPMCKDKLMEKYCVDSGFWNKVQTWIKKGWEIALHGYEHVYVTAEGGINPVNHRSEFAGLDLNNQKEKIRKGLKIFNDNSVFPKVFIAPSHTFDELTLRALIEESNIRIISDTVANDVYSYQGITFVPQQTGKLRKLPFSVVTCCYHPNMMKDEEFDELEEFLKNNHLSFIEFPVKESHRKRNIYDRFLSFLYIVRRG